MSAPIFTPFGELLLTEAALAVAGAAALDGTLRLFVGATVPSRASVTADFTEASFDGYFRQPITAGNWSAAVLLADRARCRYLTDPLEWTWGSDGQEINGWYWVHSTLGLIVAERYDSPRGGPAGWVHQITLYVSGRGEA